MSSNESKDTKYKKNFLFRVIFRIDFTSEINQSEAKLLKFGKSIKEIFINKDRQILRGLEAKISENELIHTDKQITNFRFMDEKQEQILALEPAALTLELIRYDVFEKFKQTVDFVLDAFRSVYGDMRVLRIGLRYINTINLRGDAFKWDDLIAEELIGAIKFPRNKQEVARIMTVLELSKPNCKVNFKFGLYNSEYPNTINRKEFALDYDCYAIEEKEFYEIPTTVLALRWEIKKLFEASIKKGLRDRMEVITDE